MFRIETLKSISLIVAAGSLHVTGILFVYAYPLALARSENQWDALTAALPALVFTLGGGIWAPSAGRFLDSIPHLIAIPVGLAAMAAGFLFWGTTSSIIVICLIVFFLISFGAQLAGAQGAPHLLRQFYVGNQPRAQFLASIGLSGAAFLMPLIDSLVPNEHGYGSLTLVLVGLILVVGTVAISAMLIGGGTGFDEASKAVRRPAHLTNVLLETTEYARSKSWKADGRLVGLLFGGVFGSIGVVILHFGSGILEVSETGVSLRGAEFILLIAAGGLIGRIVLSSIIGAENAVSIAFSLIIVYIVVMSAVLFAPLVEGVWGPGIAVLILGAAISGSLSIVPVIVTKISAKEYYGEMLGVVRFWSLISNIAGFVGLSLLLQYIPNAYRSGHLVIAFVCLVGLVARFHFSKRLEPSRAQ